MVTGGGSGLGREIAEAGATMHICGRPTAVLDGSQHFADPSTFADLTGMSDAQWRTTREAIRKTSDRDKAQRATEST